MRQPHLVRGPGLSGDPGSFQSAAVGFGYRAGWRLSWMTHAESFYDGKVEMRYDGLDSAARYRVAVVYAGDVYSFTRKLRLDADGTLEVHGWISKEGHPRRAEFDIPRFGHRRWRADTDMAARARFRRRRARQPDCGSVADEGVDRLGAVAVRRRSIRGLKDFRNSRALRNPSEPAAKRRQSDESGRGDESPVDLRLSSPRPLSSDRPAASRRCRSGFAVAGPPRVPVNLTP